VIVHAPARPADTLGRRPSSGRPLRPVTPRERWYVATAWGRYTTARLAHHLRGGRSRLYQIARALGLPALPKGPRP